MNLNNLLEDMFEHQSTSPKTPEDQNLDEGFLDTAKAALGSVMDFLKKKYNAIKVGVVKVMNRTLYTLFRKNSVGVSNGKKLILDIQQTGYGGGKDNVLAISIDTNSITGTAPNFVENSKGAKISLYGSGAKSESIFNKMKNELLTEAGRNFRDELAKSTDQPGAEGYQAGKTQDSTISSDARAKGRNFDAVAGQSSNFSHVKDMEKPLLTYSRGETTNFDDPRNKNILSADEVMELIRRLGYQLKFRTSLKQFVPSMLIFGKPGQGKTFIAKAMADELGLNLQAIETASVYKEVFGGMPTTRELHTVVIVDKDGKTIGSFSNSFDDSNAASQNPESGETQGIFGDKAPAKPKNIDPTTGKRKYTKKTIKDSVDLKYLLNAGMIVEGIDNGEEIVGYKDEITLAKKKYGLVQKYLTGKLPLSESNSLDLQIQAYTLRNKLTGEKIPAVIKESAAYANYAAICEEAGTQVTKIERTVFLQQVEGVLPPSGDSNGWLLLLDEFNRDAKNMNAAMNLLLSGSIGTVYFLPLKTLVLVAGNIGAAGGSGDIEEVATMTPAMITRLNFVVRYESSGTETAEYMAHDPGAWDKDVEKDRLTKENPGSMKGYNSIAKESGKLDATEEEIQLRKGCMYPSAWVNWTTAYQFFRNGDDYAPLKLTSFQEAEDTSDPSIEVNNRMISRVSENIISAAIEDWINNDLVGKFTKEDYEEWYKQEKWSYFDPIKKKWTRYKDFVSPINMYIQTYQLHPRYLALINAALMQSSGRNLQDFINSVNTSKIAGRIGGVQHILLMHSIDADNNAKDNNKKIDVQFKQMCVKAKISVITRVVSELIEIGSLSHYEELLKANNVPSKEVEAAGGPLLWLAVNINTFCDNATTERDEVFGLAYSFTKALTELKVDSESDKKSAETWEFIKSLALMLCQTDEVVNKDDPNLRTWAVEFENLGSTIVGQDYNNADAPQGFSAAKLVNSGNIIDLMSREILVEGKGSKSRAITPKFAKEFLDGTRNWIRENVKDISKSEYNKSAIQYIRAHKKESLFDIVLGAIGMANKLKRKSKSAEKAQKGER